MPTIYSTLTEDQKYTKWVKTGDQHSAVRSVLVNGGHGKMNHKTLMTPIGIATEVTDEQLEFLESIKAFCKHRDAGFITYSKKKADPETVAADMTASDGSAQKTEADFEDGTSDADENGDKPKKARLKK